MNDYNDDRVRLEGQLAELCNLIKRAEAAELGYQNALNAGRPELLPSKSLMPRKKRMLYSFLLSIPAAIFLISANSLLVLFFAILVILSLIVVFVLDAIKKISLNAKLKLNLVLAAVALLSYAGVFFYTMAYKSNLDSQININDNSGLVVMLLLELLALSAAGFGAFLLILFFFSRQNELVPNKNLEIERINQERCNAANQAIAPTLDSYQRELVEVNRLYKEGSYQSWFPKKYMYYSAVLALWEIVHDYRADNIKEAVNIYLQDLNNKYMRDAADKQVALAERQIEEQRNIAKAIKTASLMNLASQAMQGAATRNAIYETGRANTQAISNASRASSQSASNIASALGGIESAIRKR